MDEHKTFILTGYVIPCSGTVVAWEFCYQISDTPSVRFYPGIWRIVKLRNGTTIYKRVQSNNVITLNQNSTLGNFTCKNFTLPDRNQFTAPAGSVIGLYSNKGTSQTLLLITEVNSSITTYQVHGYRKNVNNAQLVDVNYNIAIRVHISK